MTETRGEMTMGMPKKILPASGSDGGGERCLTCLRPRLGSSKVCERCSRLARTDITWLLPVRLFLTYCQVCRCYLHPPRTHVRADRNSKQLLNHCARCILRPLPRSVRLLKAEFIESSDKDVIKVNLKLRGEISEGAISDRHHLTEFTVRQKLCKICCILYPRPWRCIAVVGLRQQHIQFGNNLSCLEKAMSEQGLTCRAIKIQEHGRGTDYSFSDRTHALDLVQFIEGVVPVKKESIKNDFICLHIIPICVYDLISGSLVGGGDNLMICTKVAAHGVSLMDPFTLQEAFLTAEDYWRAPFHVMFSSILLVEYLVLDIIPDPPVADDDDSYCLAHAHIVHVSDLGKRDDHNKLMVRTHLRRLLKPGDYVLGYDVGATEVILVKKGYQLQKKKSIGDTGLDGIRKDEYEEEPSRQLEDTRLGLINPSPHQISKESPALITNQSQLNTTWVDHVIQSHGQRSQQRPMSRAQSLPSKMQLASNFLQQQRLEGPGSLLEAHNAIEQKPLIQTQRALKEGSSSSSESTTQTGNAGVVDWQEEWYQKLVSLKELYYADLIEFRDMMNMILKQFRDWMNMILKQQGAHLLTWKQSDAYQRLKVNKTILEHMLLLMETSTSKNSVPDVVEGRFFQLYEKIIVSAATAHRRSKKMRLLQNIQDPKRNLREHKDPNVGNAQPVPHQMQFMDNHEN